MSGKSIVDVCRGTDVMLAILELEDVDVVHSGQVYIK